MKLNKSISLPLAALFIIGINVLPITSMLFSLATVSFILISGLVFLGGAF